MATKDLINAIQCSGYAGTSGQSFRNHVAGAASGAWLKRDYSISTWAGWASSPASQGSPGPTFDSGQVFDLSTTILGGSRISYITKAGSGAVTLTNLVKPDSASVVLQSSTIANTPGVNVAPTVDASVEITSGYNTGSAPSLSAGTAMSPDGAHDTGAPDTGYGYMHFFVTITGGNGISDGGYDDISFTLELDPNAGTGHFNDVLSESFTMRMQHRGYNPADFTVEWHSNSTYTAPVTGGDSFYLYEGSYAPDSPPNPYSLWLRYKAPGVGTWTNVGQVDCYDGRISY